MAQKILVIDDRPFMLRLIQHHLEKAGYELIKARNTREAHEALERDSSSMTALDGSVANGPSNHGVTVIRVTDVPPTMGEEPQTEGEVVLTRPFSPTQLLAEVKRLVPGKNCA